MHLESIHIINFVFSLVLPETISKVLVSSTPDPGPLISDTIAVTPDRAYDVKVELYLTDMDASSEYVDIVIDGQNVGTCTPSICQGCCTLHDCAISPSQITSSSSSMSISMQYSNQVEGTVATCPVDGQNWAAAALITLTGKGLLMKKSKLNKEKLKTLLRKLDK